MNVTDFVKELEEKISKKVFWKYYKNVGHIHLNHGMIRFTKDVEGNDVVTVEDEREADLKTYIYKFSETNDVNDNLKEDWKDGGLIYLGNIGLLWAKIYKLTV